MAISNISDIFGNMPPEISTMMMGYLSPEDLHNLTRASPIILHHFHGNHKPVLRHHLSHIRDHYGDIAAIPLIMLATRLRRLRDSLLGQPASEVERKLQPTLDYIKSRGFETIPTGWESNLSIISAAVSMIPELCSTFSDWQTMLLYRPPTEEQRQPLAEIPDWESWRFCENYLRFDCYANIVHYDEKQAFLDKPSLGRHFFRPFLPRIHQGSPVTRRLLYFNPFNYLSKKYQRMIARTCYSIKPHPDKDSQIRMRQGCKKINQSKEEWKAGRLASAGWWETAYLSNILASQGIRRFIEIDKMDDDCREQFLVRGFSCTKSVRITDKKRHQYDLKRFGAIRRDWH